LADEVEAAMFEDRLTDRARRILRLAGEESRRLGQASVGAEHVLLGLARVGNGVAVEVLDRLKAWQPLREWALEFGGVGTDMTARLDGAAGSLLPTGTTVERVVLNAAEEARGLEHPYVGSEDLLLGLMHESEGTAAEVFKSLGASIEDVRTATQCVLGFKA
jgi:ATP-dependent Clp protease ATP-binding subunit ClpC